MKLLSTDSILDPKHQIKVFFLDEITSTQSNHREALRELIFNHISPEVPNLSKEHICNLEELPRIPGGAVSLSHSRKACAFAYSLTPINLGIDIESIDRLNPKLIERISTQTERENCPNSDWFFSAKEAAWKALNKLNNVATISQIDTFHWKSPAPNWQSFEVKIDDEIIDGQGFVYEISDTYLSFFVTPSTFD